MSTLEKLEKAKILLKRDGFWSGTQRLASSFFRTLKPAKSGDILFVTGGLGVGASSQYRCHNQIEELSINGFECSFTIQDSPFLNSYADKFKVFIFHRPIYNEKLKKFIEDIKKYKREIIFETDDLFFDPAYLDQIEYLKNASPLEKEAYKNGFGSEILNDPYVKTCVTTTSFLAERLKAKGKQVFVSTNKLSVEECKIAEGIIKHRTYNIEQKTKCSVLHVPCSMITLGYFSGTDSHDKDFAEITEVIVNILAKYEKVKLFLVGPLKIDERLEGFGGRVIRQSFVSGRKKFLETVAKADINLAPLEKNNLFCEAKSELKWIGAGILAIPTVASATRTFREAIRDGQDGFVADTNEEWFAKLEKLIVGKDLRKSIGDAARRSVLEKYTTQNAKNEEYYNYLRNHIT